MKSIITIIPEDKVLNTLIETSDNVGISCIEFHNSDLSLEKGQKELYDWKYATIDAFKDEYEGDSDDFEAIFLRGYMTEDEAEAGHRAIIADIMENGQKAECLQ